MSRITNYNVPFVVSNSRDGSISLLFEIFLSDTKKVKRPLSQLVESVKFTRKYNTAVLMFPLMNLTRFIFHNFYIFVGTRFDCKQIACRKFFQSYQDSFKIPEIGPLLRHNTIFVFYTVLLDELELHDFRSLTLLSFSIHIVESESTCEVLLSVQKV